MDRRVLRARRIAKLLDSNFKIFGFQFGIDPILGLIPGGGDLISALLAGYIIYTAIALELPKREITKMVLNVAIDLVAGSLPIAGDLADFLIKPNERNLEILESFLKRKASYQSSTGFLS